jgi:transaldolase
VTRRVGPSIGSPAHVAGSGSAIRQRPLWASTGVKDPAYHDTRYVDELVSPGVVNTMPEQTLRAVADHGRIRGDTIHGTYAAAQQVLDDLEGVGVSYDDVVRVLEDEGISTFTASGNELFEQLDTELHTQRAAA